MKTGMQLPIKGILWGLFIALNVIPLIYPNESTTWTLRAIGYQVEGLEMKGLSSLKISHFIDDSKDRYLEIKDLTLNLSRDSNGIMIDLSALSLSYKDRHLPNYKVKDLLKGMMAINGVTMGPTISILALNIEHLYIEFSESSSPFKVESLKVANVTADDQGIHVGALQMKGPNLRFDGKTLDLNATPEQFADIEAPLNLKMALQLAPLAIETAPLKEEVKKLEAL
jgi:hypothetical protein